MKNSSVIFLIISAFVFVPLFLAEIARNKTRPTGTDFFLQSRTMGIFPMFATVFATWMSAFAFMGAISYFYEQGPVYMTTVGWDAMFAVLFYFIGRRIWFYGKVGGYITPTDFFHDMYGSNALDIIVTSVSFIFTMFYIQLQMVGGLLLIQASTNGYIPWTVSGLIFYVVLVIYMWAGGLRAVVMADAFYGALIIITIFASGIFLIKTAGGMEHVFSAIASSEPSHVALIGPDKGNRILLWLCLFLIVPLGAFMGPQIWIRNYAAKGQKNFEAIPFWLSLASIIFVGTLLSGSAGIVLSPSNRHPDTLIANLMLENAKPIFATFIFLGICAAIFSTANSQIHAVATIYSVDIHKKHINKNIPDRNLLTVAKWSVLIISAGSYILLLVLQKSIFNMAVIANGGTAQLIVPLLGALFWDRSSSKGAISGILSGLCLFILLALTSGFDISICAAVGLITNFLVFIIVSIISKPNEKTSEKIHSLRELFKNEMRS